MARKTLIQFRRDTSANLAAIVPAAGEPVNETPTTGPAFVRIGDGSTAVASLPKIVNILSADISDTQVIKWDSASGKFIGHTLASGHTQNTDTGTTSAAFQLLSGSAGVKIKSASGVLEVRNGADDAYADLKCKDLIVSGTTFTVNAETVTIDDNVIVLNNNAATGADGGVEVERGSTGENASLLWSESTARWKAGVAGSEVTIMLAGDAPTAHAFIDTTGHSASGLTTGHFLKATGATTYAFGAHGLTYTDVGAAATAHTHTGTYIAQPGSEERGDILYYGASAYAVLHHGNQYQFLMSGGHGADVSWGDIDGGSA